MMINKPVIGVAAAVVLIAAGTWDYLQSRHAAIPPAATTEPPAAGPAAAAGGTGHPASGARGRGCIEGPAADACGQRPRDQRGARPTGGRRRDEGLLAAGRGRAAHRP